LENENNKQRSPCPKFQVFQAGGNQVTGLLDQADLLEIKSLVNGETGKERKPQLPWWREIRGGNEKSWDGG